jgi:PEGA domain
MLLKRSGIALFNLLFIAACSSTGGVDSYFPAAGNNPIKVESVPSGAEVYVMGEKVGVTPLQINRKEVFPNTYPRDKESVYGRIILKKEGCSDFTRTVSAEISNAGLHAQLDCGDLYTAQPGASRYAPRNNLTVEQRLQKIKDLLNKGLINEEEAKKARERVINDL